MTAKYNDGTEFVDEFNTVIFAIGRDACTANIGLDKIGVALNPKNGKILHDAKEQTNVANVFAIGDVLDGKPELTPVAIQSGKLLARRLAGENQPESSVLSFSQSKSCIFSFNQSESCIRF